MSSSAKDWLTKAEADFGSANWEMQAAKPNFDAVVFHGQQRVEKMLKGVLVRAGVTFERTHELNVLAHQVKQSHPAWPWDPVDLAALQPGAVLLRYPEYNATAADAARALEALERLRGSLLGFFD